MDTMSKVNNGLQFRFTLNSVNVFMSIKLFPVIRVYIYLTPLDCFLESKYEGTSRVWFDFVFHARRWQATKEAWMKFKTRCRPLQVSGAANGRIDGICTKL